MINTFLRDVRYNYFLRTHAFLLRIKAELDGSQFFADDLCIGFGLDGACFQCFRHELSPDLGADLVGEDVGG